MTADVRGPGGTIDVSDRPARELGRVTAIGVDERLVELRDRLDNIKGYVDQLEGFADQLEPLLTSITGMVDGVEALLTQIAAGVNVTDRATRDLGRTSTKPSHLRTVVTRADGQPDYLGKAPPGAAEADPVWTVTKFRYQAATADAPMLEKDDRENIRFTNHAAPQNDGAPAWTF